MARTAARNAIRVSNSRDLACTCFPWRALSIVCRLRPVSRSRKSKSLYIEARVLGELSRLQLLANKQADARASIEEALQIDRANRYDWEAAHLLGMASVSPAESKADKAIEFSSSARDLAVRNENI